jgi:hypothetical protein
VLVLAAALFAPTLLLLAIVVVVLLAPIFIVRVFVLVVLEVAFDPRYPTPPTTRQRLRWRSGFGCLGFALVNVFVVGSGRTISPDLARSRLISPAVVVVELHRRAPPGRRR